MSTDLSPHGIDETELTIFLLFFRIFNIVRILCYKDVDNIMNVFGESFNDTRIIVNTSLSAAGGDLVENIHWSSSESHKDISNGGAYLMNFEECYAVPVKKSYDGVVRAVCAF